MQCIEAAVGQHPPRLLLQPRLQHGVDPPVDAGVQLLARKRHADLHDVERALLAQSGTCLLYTSAVADVTKVPFEYTIPASDLKEGVMKIKLAVEDDGGNTATEEISVAIQDQSCLLYTSRCV